ncbi:MAG: universal stress protein [Deltaproteobacteria bacterium]|nr:universal stress protein [Deltaproteobacteria bacterium]
MYARLLHVFRNTPLGRETLLQSVYFCRVVGVQLVIYVPEFTKFLMYFENEVVQVDLDNSYLKWPQTAVEHAGAIAEQGGVAPEFFKPKEFTASTLPDVPTNFDFMSCPRSMSDLSSRVGLGHIGPRVRHIVRAAHFPVLIPSAVYKEWHSIAVFFGGSANAARALKLGLRIHEATGLPIDIFTQMEKDFQHTYEQVIHDENIKEDLENNIREWYRFETGSFEENLYEVPHDALVILGAYGHGVVREILFGSKMELIQSTIANSLLIVGPKYKAVGWRWRR